MRRTFNVGDKVIVRPPRGYDWPGTIREVDRGGLWNYDYYKVELTSEDYLGNGMTFIVCETEIRLDNKKK